MTSKSKAEGKTPVLKGQEAEDKILEYMKLMNRPFGAVDVAANLKGAVPKATTQKILVALADKGELTQKTYGKTTFFVANQAKITALPAAEIATLENELKAVEEEHKILALELRNASGDLMKLKTYPTDLELDSKITELIGLVTQAKQRLQPLRCGAPPISAENLEKVHAEWAVWRAEWVRRRKIFMEFWQLATDALTPKDASALAEDLGIEWDTSEHLSLERGAMCVNKKGQLKRKRA